MKTVFLASLALSLLALHSNAAQAHDPYYYEPDHHYLQQYDPYYELHQIHYKLYLNPYSPYSIRYYAINPVQVFVIGGQAREVRPGPPARKR